jgi:STE24 endopeptidase
MTPETLFLILVVIVCANFAIEQWLDYLNTTTWSDVLPASLEGIYSPSEYQQQQQYEKVNYRFGLFTSGLTFITTLLFLLLGGFAWLDGIVRHFSGNPVWQALLFFGLLAFTASILQIPFNYYHTFVIEERFGFNKSGKLTFFIDLVKGWMLGAFIGGGLLALIVFIYSKSGNWAWLLAWIGVSGFSIFISYFYTTLLVPVFNKLVPLPEGELRDQIYATANKANFSLKNIFIMDGSKRSSRGNAYFSGFGRKKSIVLFDTLVQKHTVDELASILAHEIGHYKKKHVLKGLISGIIQSGIILFLLSLFLKSALPSYALGADNQSFHLSVIAFGILFSPLSMVTGMIFNSISRKHEYEADKFAVTHTKKSVFSEALKKLSVSNLSNLTPHPWYVFVHYSHPTLLQRIAAIESDTDES